VFHFVVFDLDGTLIDSRRDLADSANALLTACGCAAQPEEAIGRMVGDGAATLVARAFAASGCPAPGDALPRFLALYGARLLTFTRPYPGIVPVVAELAARLPIAVLTNKPLASTRRILEGLDLSQHFRPDLVVGGDGPFARKPDPASLLHLAATTGVLPEQTLLVGDSIIDWKTAHAAGTGVCLARYGFGFDEFLNSCLSAGDRVIDKPADLLRIL
jgi:phosphoglycolate phosphatase